MKTKENIKFELVGILGSMLIRLLFCATRVEYIGFDKIKSIFDTRQFIFATWHSRLLLFSYIYRGQDGTILISRSKDGEFAARIVKHLGHETVRGSASKRGMRALLGMIKNLTKKKNLHY